MFASKNSKPTSTCKSCGKRLVPANRSSEGHVVQGDGPFACHVKGLPTLKCEACGKVYAATSALALSRKLRDYVAEALTLSMDDAQSGDPGQVALYDPARVGAVTIDLGSAPSPPGPNPDPKALPMFEEKAVEALRSLDELDLVDDVRDALLDFVALARAPEVLKEALGPSLHRDVDALFLALGGKPGVGKTHIAEGLARELGRPLFVLNAGAINSALVGETEKNLLFLFEQARTKDVVLFIDEADSFADARLRASNGHEKALNQVRNALITELNRHRGVVIFATNLRDSFDPALARRMEDVHVPSPDAVQRRRLWKRVLNGVRVLGAVDDVWIQALDRRVERHEREKGDPDRPFTAADMRKVVCKAAARALRRAGDQPVALAREDVERALSQRLGHLAAVGKQSPDEVGAVRGVSHSVSGILRTTAGQLRAKMESTRRARPSKAEKSIRYQVAAEAVMTSQEKELEHVLDVLEELVPVLAAENAEEQLMLLKAMRRTGELRAA